jgi:hypothetical protein
MNQKQSPERVAWGHIPNAGRKVASCRDLFRGAIAMSTTTQSSTGFIGLRHRISALVNDPNFSAVALFSALGLLTSFYFMTHFPFPVEDATFLAPWL